MNFTLKVWRQKNAGGSGGFQTYAANNIPAEASFLEMMDIVNNGLEAAGQQPAIVFDHDCREGICGMCGLVINGLAHGPGKGITTCQLYMRQFSDGETITIEPWRAAAFPVIKDLIVDRSAFERIQQAGGYVSVSTGNAQDANCLPVSKVNADMAMDAAMCIGCGACVAACKNASAMLFTSAKVSHLALLPQGAPERQRRVLAMVEAMDAAGFGNCTNEGECEASCPKNISLSNISRMNREYLLAKVVGGPPTCKHGD
jgi:succinate dehydrogenase / fumarate reductase iron-sulfur subunit